MKKILQINSTCNWGSTGRIAEDIGSLVIQEGWESYFAFGRNSLNSLSHKLQIGNKKDYYTHALLTRITDRTGYYSKGATKQFIDRLEDIKPDIIHLHNIHGYYINIELLFKYIIKHNIPVVWTLHDCWSFSGHCSYFDYVNCYKWKNECYNCPQKGSYPASNFIDNSRRNFHNKKKLFTSVDNMTLVPVSNWLKGLVEESFLNKYPIEVIHNGIDLERFKPTEGDLKNRNNIQGKSVILGVASEWSKRKGLNDFIELSELISSDTVIVLVGISDEIKKKLPNNIISINRTNSIEELAQWYTTADVFINPTYEDNFPTTNLEALACGTPVITYCTGGSIEAVDDETGIIVEKGNVTGLKDAINNITSNKLTYNSLNCRKRAETYYNKKFTFQKYIELYNKILNK